MSPVELLKQFKYKILTNKIGLQRRGDPFEGGVLDLRLAGHRQLLEDRLRVRPQEKQAQVPCQLLSSFRTFCHCFLGKYFFKEVFLLNSRYVNNFKSRYTLFVVMNLYLQVFCKLSLFSRETSSSTMSTFQQNSLSLFRGKVFL